MTGHFGALSDHCEEDDGSGSSQWREKFIIIRRATEACYRMQRTKKGCFFLLDTLPWALDDVLAKNHGLLFCNKYVKTQCPNSFNSSPSETFGGPCMYTGCSRVPLVHESMDESIGHVEPMDNFENLRYCSLQSRYVKIFETRQQLRLSFFGELWWCCFSRYYNLYPAWRCLVIVKTRWSSGGKRVGI